jgi:hypothetical protein
VSSLAPPVIVAGFGFCELVAKFADDMTAKETAKEHGGRQLKEVTSHQRHRIRQRLDTGAWRDFHENKTARLPYVDPSTPEYARGGEPRKPERSRMPLGRKEPLPWPVGGSAGDQGIAPPPRRRRARPWGRPDVSASLAVRTAVTQRRIDSTD